MKLSFALVSLFILACLMIAPVMAETLTGTLGGTGVSSSTYNTAVGGLGGAGPYVHGIVITNIEYVGGTSALIRQDSAGTKCTFSAGAPSGSSTPFVGKLTDSTGIIITTGTIGYQRYFNFLGIEEPGYQWIEFNSWQNTTGLTGDKRIYFELNASAIYSMHLPSAVDGYPFPAGDGDIYFGSVTDQVYPDGQRGQHQRNVIETVYSQYNLTKPLGIGIKGTITKTVDGTTYASQILVINATDNIPFASDYTINSVDFNINTVTPSIKIAMKTPSGIWYNSSTLFYPAPVITPTPTPIPTGDYYLSITSPYVNVGGTITATISSPSDPGLSNLIGIQYYATDPVNPSGVYFYEAASLPTSYWKYGANWVGYSDLNSIYTNTKSGIPNPIGLVCNVQGNKTLTLVVTKSNNQTQILTYPIYVGLGSNYLTTRIQSIEGMGGGILTWTTINVYNKNLHTWQNGTTFTGAVEISAAPGTLFDVYGTKSGYVNAQLLNIPAREDITYQLPFFTGVTPSAGNQSMAIRTVNAEGVAISGVLIQVTEAGTATTYVKTSNTGGAATFTLKQSTLYTVHVTKTGWRASDDSFTTTTASSDSWVVMMYPGAAPTATIPRTTAPVPTGSWTVSPSVTPFGNGTTFWQPWVNVFSQMGASSYELPLLIAGLIIILCMIIGAASAGVLGAEVGMGFGAILSVALGLIPIWVVIAIIVLGFLFYGLKVAR